MNIKEHVVKGSTWLRGFFILLYVMIFWIAKVVAAGIILFQFGTLLFTGQINQRLQPFARSLSLYLYQIAQYLMFNTEEKPFPFNAWPQVDDDSADNGD